MLHVVSVTVFGPYLGVPVHAKKALSPLGFPMDACTKTERVDDLLLAQPAAAPRSSASGLCASAWRACPPADVGASLKALSRLLELHQQSTRGRRVNGQQQGKADQEGPRLELGVMAQHE